MKYIIDIPDEVKWIQYIQQTRPGIQNLKVKSVCDMTPYTEPDCKAIEDEVWELVRFIINTHGGDLYDIFSHIDSEDVIKKMNYQEAKARYKAWKKQKNEIHVGDEVTISNNKKGIVVCCHVPDVDIYAIFTGNFVEYCPIRCLTKTGRSFPELAELLKKMREDGEG